MPQINKKISIRAGSDSWCFLLRIPYGLNGGTTPRFWRDGTFRDRHVL